MMMVLFNQFGKFFYRFNYGFWGSSPHKPIPHSPFEIVGQGKPVVFDAKHQRYIVSEIVSETQPAGEPWNFIRGPVNVKSGIEDYDQWLFFQLQHQVQGRLEGDWWIILI